MRSASAASGVYSGPSIWITGSPGIRRSMKKTSVAQPQMMKSDWIRRRMMYWVMARLRSAVIRVWGHQAC